VIILGEDQLPATVVLLAWGATKTSATEQIHSKGLRLVAFAYPKREYSAWSSRFCSTTRVFPHPSSPISHTPIKLPIAAPTRHTPFLPSSFPPTPTPSSSTSSSLLCYFPVAPNPLHPFAGAPPPPSADVPPSVAPPPPSAGRQRGASSLRRLRSARRRLELDHGPWRSGGGACLRGRPPSPCRWPSTRRFAPPLFSSPAPSTMRRTLPCRRRSSMAGAGS
jgi:hypothetical protein